MGPVRLNEREQLIERILKLSDDQVAMAVKLLEALPDDPTWSDEDITPIELERRNALDLAAVEATRGEDTVSFEDVLKQLGIED